MKWLLFLTGLLACQIINAQIITYNPKVESQVSPSLSIQKVNIKDSVTEISFLYIDNFSNGKGNIYIDPQIKVMAVGGRRIFKFLRAENIPVLPNKRELKTKGEEIAFKLIFEKIDPGIIKLDIFECNNYDNVTCFDFYGVQISNPLPKQVLEEKKKDKPIIKKTIINQGPKVTFNGKVLNSKTNKPIEATLNFEILPGENIVGNTKSQASTGTYSYSFSPQKSFYAYYVAAKGYLSIQESFDLTKLTGNKTFSNTILLIPIEMGETFRLNNIFFPAGEFTLLSSSYGELNKLVEIMKDNPTMNISLEGHTDIIGNPNDNYKLSENRVKVIKDYLVKNGIDGTRIALNWYGGSKPLVATGTDEERQVNRRVEFKILKK